MEKEYAEYMYQRLKADTAIRLIRSFPLRTVEQEVLIDGLVGHRGRRGWQKFMPAKSTLMSKPFQDGIKKP